MAAIVQTRNSVEVSAVPPVSVTGYGTLKPTQSHGRQRIASFEYQLLGTEVSGTDIIALCKLPKNARVIQITFTTSATTGTSTFPIGLGGYNGNGFIDDTSGATVADSTTFFGTVPAVAGAQTALVANTQAQNNLYTLKKDCMLFASIATANQTGTALIRGFVEYVVD